MRIRWRLLPLVALLALALAGCGGGDEEAADTAPLEATEAAPLSKEELLAQADAICAEVNAAVGTVGSTSTGSDGQARQVADLYGGMVERLKGLGAPSEDGAGYERLSGAAEQLAQAHSDVALAAERGEAEALASAESEAETALSAFRSAASSYGAEQCGEAPSAPVAGTPGEAGGGEEASGVEEEAAPEVEAEAEAAPESGGAGAVEEEGSGGGAAAGGGGSGGGGGGSGGGSSGGIGPG